MIYRPYLLVLKYAKLVCESSGRNHPEEEYLQIINQSPPFLLGLNKS